MARPYLRFSVSANRKSGFVVSPQKATDVILIHWFYPGQKKPWAIKSLDDKASSPHLVTQPYLCQTLAKHSVTVQSKQE